MQEHANIPGAVSVPGPGRGGNIRNQDVTTLVGMGFTVSQAESALMRNNSDVHRAADYLLGGGR
jgi:uncharacterized UBP type Zn finger protein